MRLPVHIPVIIFLIAVLAPVHVRSRIPNEPFDQKFLVTAYYSPKPDQCCYIKGGLTADMILNGEGHTTADGSPVFPGVIAAPPSYPFGTRVHLPGIGVFEVRDRGGAIQEHSDGVHRLDIWVGEGELGLARALEIGGRSITGRVFPPGTDQPHVRFSLDDIHPAWDDIRTFQVASLLDLHPQSGDRSFSTVLLQESLRDLEFFRHAVTGLFGPVTRNALRAFLRRYDIDDPAHTLTEQAAAYLMAALREKGSGVPIPLVDSESSPKMIRMTQRALRYLGHYRGRTGGDYDENIRSAILAFQLERGIVQSGFDTGAGRIGPQTYAALRDEWNQKRIVKRAGQILFTHNIRREIIDQGMVLTRFLGEGDAGPSVRRLQHLLVYRGYFPMEKVNGVFGPLTKQSVLNYQLVEGLISGMGDPGAGYVGPATLRVLEQEEVGEAVELVRAHGWQVL